MLEFGVKEVGVFDGYIFKVFEFVGELSEDVKLQRDDLFSHHTVAEISIDDESLSLKDVFFREVIKDLYDFFHNLGVFLSKLLGELRI